MCPLVAAPNRGYADWQRVENYDSGVLWAQPPTPGSAAIISPVLDMSRYAYLGGSMQNQSSNSCVVQLAWFADAAAGTPLGQRTFTLNGLIANPAQVRIPNLGPFLVVTVTNVGGTSFTFTASLIGTNRVYPVELIPVNPQVIRQSGISTPANGQTSVFPVDYFAGPARLFFESASGNSIELFSVLATGASSGVEVFQLPTNVGSTTISVLCPPGFWFINVINGQSVTIISQLAVTPTLTGSL